jgi:hypothetical protein
VALEQTFPWLILSKTIDCRVSTDVLETDEYAQLAGQKAIDGLAVQAQRVGYVGSTLG